MPPSHEPQSSLSTFLLSKSTLICLVVRLAIMVGCLPKNTSRWLHHPSFQSLFVRSVQHNDIQRFDETQSWNVQAPVPPLVFQLLVLVADLGTSCIFVHLANILRRLQDHDEEEKIANDMPKVIRPTCTVFATTESDETCLISRHDLANLSGSLYFWGTMVSSSATTHVYSGVLFSVVNVLCGRSIPSDSFVPLFLLPVLLTLKEKNRPIITAVMLFGTVYYYMVTLPLVNVEIPIFSTPNLGLQWYFSMQVFDRFRSYFSIMFFGLRYVLVLPLVLRFQHLPVELMGCLWFVYMIFHVHPTVTDLCVGLSLLLLSPRSLCRVGIPSLVALVSLPVPLSLYILDWYMWLETGAGNANFIYFQCLAYNAFCAMLFIDFCGATVRRQTALHLTTIELAARQSGATNGGDGDE